MRFARNIIALLSVALLLLGFVSVAIPWEAFSGASPSGEGAALLPIPWDAMTGAGLETLPVTAPASCRPTGRGLRVEGTDPSRRGRSSSSSSSVVVGVLGRDTVAVVADRDDRALVAVTLSETPSIRARVALPGRPEQLLLLPDGRLVTSLGDASAVIVHELTEGGFVPRCRRATPVEPAGLASAGTGAAATMVVVSRGAGQLLRFDGPELVPGGAVDLPRDPYAVAVTRDGTTALVTHVVGGIISRVALGSRRASPMERLAPTEARRVEVKRSGGRRKYDSQFGRRRRPLVSVRATQVAQRSFSVAAVEAGRFVVPSVLVDPTPEPRGGAGYGAVGALATPHRAVNLDLAPDGTLPHFHRQFRFGGARYGAHRCLLPRGADYDRRRRALWVACRGSSLVLGFDRPARPQKDGLRVPRAAVKVPEGPDGVAVTEDGRLVVWSPDAGALAVHVVPERVNAEAIPQFPPDADTIVTLRRHRDLPPEVRRGRHLFHLTTGRRTAADGRACASCHPDGRDDGMTWITADGPRQTPILVGRLDEELDAPFGWNGRNDTVDDHVQRTLHRLRGTGLDAEERRAIFAYLRHAAPPPLPDQEATVVARGRELFEAHAMRCAYCHGVDDGSPDGRQHDFGHPAPGDRRGHFDTPSLRFIGRSAPYFHDGRYPTLAALLADHDSNMGGAFTLSSDDRFALERFLRTL